MARYVRGQLCGVDNCPSRLWKRVNGQNVCQYGHVNEYDIEIDDADDMNFGGGAGGAPGLGDFSRRLTNVAGLTTSQLTREKVNRLSSEKVQTRKYGEDFKTIQAQCFQIILAKNTKFIVQKLNLSEDQGKLYFSVCKLIWIKVLNHHLLKKNAAHTYNIGFIITINYLAAMQMNLPLYLCDFITLTHDKTFNLEKSEYALSRSLRIQIPISQLSVFHGHSTYNYIQHIVEDKFCRDLIRSSVFESELNYYPLLTRTALNLYLPIDIIKLVRNYITYNDINFSFYESIKNEHIHPELKLAAIIIVFTKVYFFNQSKMTYYKWHHRYLMNEGKFNFIDLKKRIYYKSSFKDLYNWDTDQVDSFINFYNANVLPNISASNIASTNEIKDKNKLQIVKSIQELFDMEFVSDDSSDKRPSSAQDVFDDYTAFLSGVYAQQGEYTPPKNSSTDFHHPFLMESLFQHYTALYNCSDLELREALRRAWKHLHKHPHILS